MKIIKLCVVAAILAAGGCSAADDTTTAAPAPAATSAAPSAAAATPGIRIGAAGSACELPLSFEVAADWKPVAVDVKALGELAELARVGAFTTVCEIDAKPAGNIGFLRVYVAKGLSGQPRDHLTAFVKAGAGKREVSGATYRDVQLAAQQGAEVTWEVYDKALDHRSKYSAFAVNTKAGAVVVQLSPFGEDEHPAMLPAFTLAGSSLKVDA